MNQTSSNSKKPQSRSLFPQQKENEQECQEPSTLDEINNALEVTSFYLELRHPSKLTVIISLIIGMSCLKVSLVFGIISFLVSYVVVAYLLNKL